MDLNVTTHCPTNATNCVPPLRKGSNNHARVKFVALRPLVLTNHNLESVTSTTLINKYGVQTRAEADKFRQFGGMFPPQRVS